MSEKNKKYKLKAGRPVKASENKKIRAMRLWHLACGLLAAAIIAAGLVCQGRGYDLTELTAHGHALWFIFLLAYPGIAILSVITVAAGLSGSTVIHFLAVTNPVLGLVLIDLSWLLLLWFIFWRRGWKIFSTWYGMKVMATFVLIFAAWGGFQLLLSGFAFAGDHGGFARLQDPPPAISADSEAGAER